MWLIILSDQLPIVALVGFYPANQLIGRRLFFRREARRSPAFLLRAYAVLAWVSPGCPPLRGRFLRVTHPSATRVSLPPFDLHVLGMPPAFNLSQDQTLQFNTFAANFQCKLPQSVPPYSSGSLANSRLPPARKLPPNNLQPC